jgi:hypothetical protein
MVPLTGEAGRTRGSSRRSAKIMSTETFIREPSVLGFPAAVNHVDLCR